MSLNYTAEGYVGSSFDADSPHEAALLFRQRFGVLPEHVEDDPVVGVCCLCGLPIFERSEKLAGLSLETYRHGESVGCPSIRVDRRLIAVHQLRTLFAVESIERGIRAKAEDRAKAAEEAQAFAASIPDLPPATEEEAAFREAIARISEEPTEENRALLDRARRAHVAKMTGVAQGPTEEEAAATEMRRALREGWDAGDGGWHEEMEQREREEGW